MKIYKYREVSENTEKILTNGEIFLNKPKNFNDPFDSRSTTIYEGDFSEWKEYLLGQGLSEPEAERTAHYWKDKQYDVIDSISQDLDQSLNRVSCFSEVNNSILMWSHYAKNHTGVCIEFSPKVEGDSVALHLEPNQILTSHPYLSEYAPLFPIQYTKTMAPPFNRLKDNTSRIVHDFFLRKHEDWSYEKERRILFTSNLLLNNPLRVKKSSITGIFLGVRIEKSEKQKYIKICKEHYIDEGLPFKIFQAVPDLTAYSVIFEELRV